MATPPAGRRGSKFVVFDAAEDVTRWLPVCEFGAEVVWRPDDCVFVEGGVVMEEAADREPDDWGAEVCDATCVLDAAGKGC